MNRSSRILLALPLVLLAAGGAFVASGASTWGPMPRMRAHSPGCCDRHATAPSRCAARI